MESSGIFSRATPQYLLSDMFHAELLHTLGAYQLAGESIAELISRLPSETPEQKTGDGASGPSTSAEEHDPGVEILREVLTVAKDCNQNLRNDLHNPDSAITGVRSRHPAPCQPPPTLDADLLQDVWSFYDGAVTALRSHIDSGSGASGVRTDRERLGFLLAVVHDPQQRASVSALASDDPGLQGRVDRMLHRREQVVQLRERLPDPVPRLRRSVGIAEMLRDHMGDDRGGAALYLTILRAMSQAHIHMHYAEHLRSQRFGEMLTEIPETDAAMRSALECSLVLNTFAYVASRSVPWVFAEDQSEYEHVVHPDRYAGCCETLTPTFCMWIASQASMLALHRRAYTYWTLGERDRAFRDFYKLTRLLRDLRRRSEKRAGRAPGTRTLIEGLSAIAEHHIGRIYRGQHAHGIALRYFDRASSHVHGWEDHGEISAIFKNSRWRVNLLVSQAKANYELGRIKQSLLHYAQAWQAFLLLGESEGHSKANMDVVGKLVKWLEEIKGEPEVSKTELRRHLEPMVDQFETVYGPTHLRLLAADIMMRLGHLLFILKLPPEDWLDDDSPPRPDHLLARRCLVQAGILDPTSTLIAGDLLKARRESSKRELHRRDLDPAMAGIADQWPSGSGRFEEAARVIEYVLQHMLDRSEPEVQPDGDISLADRRRDIARELLGSFLAHTDSSNVKLAQVYRYLMQESRGLARDTHTNSPSIDVICLRRYSSFFPFLPRPAAFRAPGGGYLVQVCEAEPDTAPFGIAVDPGPNFLDNLYRCGYSLADIQMVVLTHDHADHLASLDALLALMGTRMALGDEPFTRQTQLAIVGNESVVKRYSFYNENDPVRRDGKGEPAKRKDAVKVVSFKDIHTITGSDIKGRKGSKRSTRIAKAQIYLPPKGLRIEPVRTVDHTDAEGHNSQGFLLSMGNDGDHLSVLFTGDTGPLRLGGKKGRKRNESAGEKTALEAAVSADVVIAHLSSVPLRELRELAGLDDGEDALSKEFADLWGQAVQQARRKGHRDLEPGAAKTRFLLKQLQFGFRARSGIKDELAISPLSPVSLIKPQSEKHLYLTGLLELAEHMMAERAPDRPPLLLIGELREELGTFRTRIASCVTEAIFKPHGHAGMALTADIGLRVRVARSRAGALPADDTSAQGVPPAVSILCTTCDLDNDLIATERFHSPWCIREVCVKGEHEGVFYNCLLHDPGRLKHQPWIESVERYDPFGD